MRRETRGDKGIGRERRDKQQECGAACGTDWRGGRRRVGGHDVRRGTSARQREGMQRRGDESEQRGVDKVRALPAERLEQRVGDGPAHRRGKAAGQRQHRDRLARTRSEDAPKRREGRIVERCRHRGAEDHPHRNIDGRMACVGHRHKPGRAGERPERHHAMPAVAIDQGADGRRDKSRREQACGKSTHRKGQRKSALLRDQWKDQHRRVEDRAPGEDLRDAEDRNGTPGTDNKFAQRRH